MQVLLAECSVAWRMPSTSAAESLDNASSNVWCV
jgi:hypothetical protein